MASENKTVVAVIGSGSVGQTLAEGFAKHGYSVIIASRDKENPKLKEYVASKANASITGGSFEEAAAAAQIIVLATKWDGTENAAKLAGAANLKGKLIIDAVNPITMDQGLFVNLLPPNDSVGERVQAWAPDSHVVKAFNSVGNAFMVNPHFEQGTPTMFICGNDAASKAKVSEILKVFGWEALDMGDIRRSRCIEPLAAVWCNASLARGKWHHAFKVLTQ